LLKILQKNPLKANVAPPMVSLMRVNAAPNIKQKARKKQTAKPKKVSAARANAALIKRARPFY
jgi:hypothetical protein